MDPGSPARPFQCTLYFSLGNGIGNVLEALYAVEYCMRMRVRTCFSAEGIPGSFSDYLRECYGDIYIEAGAAVTCNYFIHSFTVERKPDVEYEYYFYVRPDYYSTLSKSETELYLEIVKALFPGGTGELTLTQLLEDEPEPGILQPLSSKIIIYPGSNAQNPVKRWPWYGELIKKLGPEEVIIIGGNDDLDFSHSYTYPSWLSATLPQRLLNTRSLWEFFRRIGLLRKWSHPDWYRNNEHVYINRFSWKELAFIFRRSKLFVGNDGGLMHFAAACGMKGIAIFGPTSVNKNKPYNKRMKSLSLNYPCQPCQYGIGNISLASGFINCPFGIKCLSAISAEQVHSLLDK